MSAAHARWVEQGEALARQPFDAFVLGDWLLAAPRRHRKLTVAVAVFGCAYGTASAAVWLASRVEPEVRRPELGERHHRAVALLPQDEQRRLLAEAVAGGWSAEDLRNRAQSAGVAG